MRNLFKILLVWGILILAGGQLLADSLVRITLKNGHQFEAVISKIEKWGLKAEDGRTIAFSVIDNIFTPDEAFVAEIAVVLPDLVPTKSARGYDYDMENIVLPTVESPQVNYFQYNQPLGIVFTGSTKKLDGLRAAIQIKPEKSKRFFFRAGFSQGSYRTGDIYRLELEDAVVDSSILEYSAAGFDIGGGISFRIPPGEILLMLNYGKKWLDARADTDTEENREIFSESRDMISISAYYHPKALEKVPLLISIGPRYYFRDIKTFENGGQLSVDIGLGFVF